jgi:alpha-1,3-rhamnosyl/mannosyltransferase
MPGIVPARLRRSLESAAAAGLPVQLLGYLDEQTLRTQYQGACLLAFIPLIEGFGLPVLEAMAFGIPVVASRVSSVVEVCGNAALLVDPHDAGAVADAIGKVLTEPPLADRLRQAGRARVLQFRWEDAARATREVYEAAALRTGAARTPSG